MSWFVLVNERTEVFNEVGSIEEAKLVKLLQQRLWQVVGEAVSVVAVKESSWTTHDMTRRLVGYIMSAASNKRLQGLSWIHCIKMFVGDAMDRFASACEDKDWFFEIDLVPAFLDSSWAVVQRFSCQQTRVPEVKCQVQEIVQDKLDAVVLTKAISLATRATFKDDCVVHKVISCLRKTHDIVSREVADLADGRMLGSLTQCFVQRWIVESMHRCWTSVGSEAPLQLNEASVIGLFEKLVIPFGDDHPYTCIPLGRGEERPQKDWLFIRGVVSSMFDAWNKDSCGSANKRKRKRSGCDGAEGMAEEVAVRFEAATEKLAEFVDGRVNVPTRGVSQKSDEGDPGCLHEELAAGLHQHERREPQEQEECSSDLSGIVVPTDFACISAGDKSGHPECTSLQDCLGSPDCRLIRHLDESGSGDVYCEACWNVFIAVDPEMDWAYCL